MIEVLAPSSKSISHRYLVAAALAQGQSQIHNVLDSDDTGRTRDILALAGARFEPITEPGGTLGYRVTGTGGKLYGGESSPLSCYVHESGTTCRILTAVLASGQGSFRIHGVPRMHERPIGDLVTSLRLLGCSVTYEGKEGYPPLLVRTRGLKADALPPMEHVGRNALPISMEESSQYFSGLLLAAPQAKAPFTIVLSGTRVVSWPYIGLTLQCLADFGIKFLVETREAVDDEAMWECEDWRSLTHVEPGCLRIKVQPGPYHAGKVQVEGDWSGASYLVAAGAVGREPVCVEGVNPRSLQGDRVLLDILKEMGANIETHYRSLVIRPCPLRGIEVDMGQSPDLVPTVAAIAAFAEGDTTITNVAHLRIKESDRIHAPAEALRRVGVTVTEREDGLTVHGMGHDARVSLEGVRFDTMNDHRIAMSSAILSLRSIDVRPAEMRRHVDNPDVVRKSFPSFWNVWEAFSNAND